MLEPIPAVTGLKGWHKLLTVPKHAFLKFILLIYRITVMDCGSRSTLFSQF